MPRFDNAILEIADQAGLDSVNVSADKDRIKRYINLTREEIGGLPYKLKELETRGYFVTVGNVTAGTAKVNTDSYEVTGASTSWTSSMDGREFKMDSENRWYRIAFVSSGTSLYLETAYQHANASSTYVIWKKFYEVPNLVKKIDDVRGSANLQSLVWSTPDDFNYYYRAREGEFGLPTVFTAWDNAESQVKYTTGTATTTANVATVNGSGTSWLANILPGDKFTLSANNEALTYTIKRVNSDTQLLLFQKSSVSSAGVGYTAERTNQQLIQLWPSVNAQDLYRFHGWKNVVALVNDEDLIEDGWWLATRAGAIAKCAAYLQRPDTPKKEAEYKSAVADLIRAQELVPGGGGQLRPIISQRYKS